MSNSEKNPVIIALDFETANRNANSACQLGLVRIEDWGIEGSQSWMIRPPEDDFIFTDLHGIAWEDVADKPDFKGHWKEIQAWLKEANFLAAHNAPFDQGVLEASCAYYGLEAPRLPYLDTVGVARAIWKIFPTKLNMVCARLNINLNHHEALSDANACAEILLRAHQEGWNP